MRGLEPLRSSLLALCLACTGAAHGVEPADPLDSPSWDVMVHTFLPGQVVFDERVQVLTPDAAEDSLAVPVAVHAEQLRDVKQIFVFSDLNPIPQVLRYYPVSGQNYIAFRMKLQQASPIRAAVQTSDGVWHVGGKWVDARGGGCTAPSHGTSSGDWADTLSEVSYRRWHREDHDRVRFKVMHPMDTGLAPGIPAFHIEKLELRDESDALVAWVEMYEPVSENPILSIDLPAQHMQQVLSLTGVDNNGNPIEAALKP